MGTANSGSLPDGSGRSDRDALVARICPVCQRRRLPKEGRGWFWASSAWGSISLMVTLREEGAHKSRKVPGAGWSVGAIVAVHGEPVRLETVRCDQCPPRQSRGADETGWRQDGSNGYVWTFGK